MVVAFTPNVSNPPCANNANCKNTPTNTEGNAAPPNTTPLTPSNDK